MKLFYSPGACSMATHIVLEELGMKYEAVKIDASKPRSPEHLKASPLGYVPALITDKGEGLCEGVAIMQYLADQKPEKNLVPKLGTWERYKMMELMNFLSTELHKGFNPLWSLDRWTTTPEAKEHLRTAVISRLSTRLDAMENMVKGGKQFLFGDTFTIADAYAFTVLNWSKMVNLDMSKWPSLLGYTEKISMRPSVQTVMKSEFGK